MRLIGLAVILTGSLVLVRLPWGHPGDHAEVR
jgi:hypothetical protein